MMKIAIELKKQLSKLLGEGHRRFGKVKQPRRPYRDDDDGGTGAADLLFETHPLLAQQPSGASSDLTFLIQEHEHAVDLAVERADDASPELQKSPVLAAALGRQAAPAPATPAPPR